MVDHEGRGARGNIEGRDWNEVATKLGRLAHYEFEDYVE
jgi:hypothetical protein